MTLTVLLIDDSKSSRLMFRKLLGVADVAIDRTLEAESAEGALRDFDLSSVDVIFTDLHLPGMDGVEFVKRARQIVPDVPIFMLTGSVDHEILISAFRHGVTDYIEKPIHLAEIEEKLRQYCGADRPRGGPV